MSGDFNGDGYSDQAIGVPGEDIGTIADAVNVIYGGPNGLTTRNDFWNQNRAGVPDAAEVADQFGAALAAGDFNDDGFGDLAVGVPGESLGPAALAGAVVVIYGSPWGLNTGRPQYTLPTFSPKGMQGRHARRPTGYCGNSRPIWLVTGRRPF